MADIVVDDIQPRIQLIAGGGLPTVFAYPFPIFSLTDLNVYQTPVGESPNDTTQILTYNVDYTVQNNVAPTVGGTITLTDGAPAGDLITIARNQPDNRLNNYIDGGLFQATVVNTDFDRSVLMGQQNKMLDVNVGVHYNISSSPVINIDTRLPVLPANCIWKKNAANDGIEAVLSSAINPYTVALPTTNNAIARFSGVDGSLKNSNIIVDDFGTLTSPSDIISMADIRTLTSFTAINRAPIILYDSTNAFFTSFRSPNGRTGSVSFNVPASDGLAGQSMITDGAGNLSMSYTSEIQVVSAISSTVSTSTSAMNATSMPIISQGVQILSLAITPKISTSKLIIEFYCPVVSNNTALAGEIFALFVDGNVNAISACSSLATPVSGSGANAVTVNLKFVTPSTSIALKTFTIRFGPFTGGATAFVMRSGTNSITFGGTAQMSLTIKEVL